MSNTTEQTFTPTSAAQRDSTKMRAFVEAQEALMVTTQVAEQATEHKKQAHMLRDDLGMCVDVRPVDADAYARGFRAGEASAQQDDWRTETINIQAARIAELEAQLAALPVVDTRHLAAVSHPVTVDNIVDGLHYTAAAVRDIVANTLAAQPVRLRELTDAQYAEAYAFAASSNGDWHLNFLRKADELRGVGAMPVARYAVFNAGGGFEGSFPPNMREQAEADAERISGSVEVWFNGGPLAGEAT